MPRPTYTFPYYEADETDTNPSQQYSWLDTVTTRRLPTSWPPPGYISDEQLTINQLNKENAPLEWFPAIQEGVRNTGRLINRERLPAEPVADENMPKWQRDLNAAFEQSLKSNPLTAGLAAITTNPRTGVRYKTWPEQMIRNAVAGAPASFDPITGHTTETTIARAQDIAGMMGGGSVARVGPEASLASSGMRNFKKLEHDLVLNDPNYVYHATNMERAQDIADSGKLNVHKPHEFTDQSVWPDSSTERRNYFSNGNPWMFAPEEGTPTILRIKKDQHPFKTEQYTNDVYSKKPVPASKIEYLDQDGSWKLLSDTSMRRAVKDFYGNELTDYHGNPIPVGEDGMLTLYHRTNENAKNEIYKTGKFKSKENTNETFFADNPESEYGKGFGEHVVAVKIDPKYVRLNDQFPSGENHYAVPNRYLSRANLLSDTSTAAPISALAKPPAPRFYSALENAVKDSKTKVASAEQWLGELRNKPGVKQEELDWVLHDLPQGQLTKAELERFVQEHKVELKEVNLGEMKFNENSKYNLPAVRRAIREAGDNPGELELTLANDGDAYRALTKKFPELAENEDWARIVANDFYGGDTKPAGTTQHSQWQLPGGENYREIIKTLPTNSAQAAEIAALKARHSANRSEVKDLIDSHGPNGNGYVNNIEKITKLSEEANSINQRLVELEKGFTHSHWPRIVNPVYHMRINDRVIPGFGKSKHVEEFQSDMHQEGRRVGYVGELENLQPEFVKINKKLMDNLDEKVLGDPDMNVPLNDAIDKGLITKKEAEIYKRYSKIEAAQTAGAKPVPDAPFKQTWPDRGLKDIIRLAAEEGADVISWTPGEAQAKRYRLSNHLKELQYLKGEDGTYAIAGITKNGEGFNHPERVTASKLPDIVGKEMAEKIIKNEGKRMRGQPSNGGYFDGIDLEIGGEGMKAFYDKMLVDKANAIAKKFGGKVESANTQLNKEGWHITPPDRTVSGKWMVKSNDYNSKGRLFDTEAEAKEVLNVLLSKDSAPIHVLRITPQLRDAALNRGFSLFADTGKVGAPLAALTRVEHNPFKLAELEKQHGVKLTPVAENPFTTDAYHGHRGPFRGQEIEPSSKDRGVEFYSVLRDPKLANVFAERQYAQNPTTKEGSGILPLKLNTKDYHTFDAKGKYWQEINDQAVFEANQLGKKGVIVKNVVETRNGPMANKQSDIAITLDPSTVRGKFAKFDPAKFGESGLLKSGGLPIYSDENGNQLLPPPRNPAQVDLPPWAQALGFKAGEYAVWLANRGNPNINGPMWAMTAAQWPLISRNIKNEIARQRAQGKDINQIIQDIPMLHDIMNLGKPPPKITPVEGNPFGTAR